MDFEIFMSSGFVILFAMSMFSIWLAPSMLGLAGFGLLMKIILTVCLIPIIALIVGKMAE